MGFPSWLTNHWFEFLQSLGIIGGLLLTGISLHIDAKVRRIANLLTLTENHRSLWTHLYQKPELGRVLQREVDLSQKPVTSEEELFVLLVVMHLSSAQQTIQAGMYKQPERLSEDIVDFFSRPIPQTVWQGVKHFQDESLIAFVEGTQREPR